MPEADVKTPLVTLAGLKERGWTPGAISRFLGEPDERRPNPRYRSAAPMRLYDAARVAAAEETDDWQAWHRRTLRGRQAIAGRMRAQHASRRQATLAAADAWRVQLPLYERQTLYVKAVAHRNALADDLDFADARGADDATLMRWAVNYLRHAVTDYDRRLDELSGVVGKAEAQQVIRRRVYAEIERAYPWLAGECARQQAERQALALR